MKKHRLTPPPSVIPIGYISLMVFFGFLLILALLLHWGQFTQRTDTLIHDAWVRAGATSPPSDVVIVGIDSYSLERVGRWPWPRDVQARLIEKLTQAGAATITMDVLFTEPDDQIVGNDLILAKAIAENKQMILPILTGEYSGGRINPEKLPIPEISMAVAGLGHVYLPIDPDGIVRRVNLKSGFKSAHWSALSLAAAELIGIAPQQLPGERLPRSKREFSWVSDYQVYIPYYGPSGTINTVSAARVLTDELVAITEIEGKHVFVGVTAVGLGDIQPTPVSSSTSSISGVEVHATIFSALRSGLLVTRAKYGFGYIVAALLFLMAIIAHSRFSPSTSLISSLLLASVPIIFSFILYKYYRLWYPPLSTSIPILISLPLWSWHRLEFISRFIQNEVDVMERALPPVSSSDNLSLVNYFNTAMDHLPIDGWRLVSHGKEFKNGKISCENLPSGSINHWKVNKNYFCKNYHSSDNLIICMNISDLNYGEEITMMVDRLARVRDRLQAEEKSDGIEQLQLKTQKFSIHMENLRRMNALRDSVFHGSPAGLVVWNVAGEFVSMNELALEMFPGALNGEPSFKSFVDMLRDRDIQKNSQKIKSVLLDKQSWQLEIETIGEEKIVDFNVVGDHFSDRLLVGSIVDVSAIRKSKRSQAEMLDYLSHDLRSPLISSIYLLSAQHEEGPGTVDKRSLQRIERHVIQSLNMIDDLLSLSHAGSLRQEEMVPTLFDNVVDSAVDQVETHAASKSIKIHLEFVDDLDLWVCASVAILQRAVVNVVDNAIKYSPDNTSISLRLSSRDCNVRLEVIDQGIGMEKHKIESLFERYKRGSNVGEKSSGMGLGLAMVSKVIEQHNGRVWAERPNKGAVVIIELPKLELE